MFSPLAVVHNKFRIIHVIKFSRAGGHSSVNDNTDFPSAPSCELGNVLEDVLLAVWFLRQIHGVTARIVFFCVNVKCGFRKVLVDPAGATVFGYAMREYIAVDFRFKFVWGYSPGFRGVIAFALEHADTSTLRF